MLRVPVQKIRPGMVLARPIPLPHDPFRYLLQRDVEIPMDLVPRLEQLGILEVWIRHRELEFLEDIIDEGLADRQREVYVHVRQNFEAILRDTAAEIDLVHFQSSIMALFSFLKGSAGSDVLLQKLDAFDNYLMSHSTNVCYLALLLGMKLERFLIDAAPPQVGAAGQGPALAGPGMPAARHRQDACPRRNPQQALTADARRDAP